MKIDKGNIENVIEAYFDCTLTEAEEKELRLFLATTELQSSAIDEAKAVMGIFAMERNLQEKTSKTSSIKISKSRNIIRYAAAACVVLAVTIAGAFIANNADSDICIMYADGQKIDDAAIVLAQMNKELDAVGVVDDNIDQAFFNELQDISEAMETLN